MQRRSFTQHTHTALPAVSVASSLEHGPGIQGAQPVIDADCCTPGLRQCSWEDSGSSWRFADMEVQFAAPEAGARASLRGYRSRPLQMRGLPQAAKRALRLVPSYLPTLQPSYLPWTCLPSYLSNSPPSYIPTFLPSYLPTFLPSYLPTTRAHSHHYRSFTPPTLLPPFLPTHRAARTIKKA